jgi:hypothetical protein
MVGQKPSLSVGFNSVQASISYLTHLPGNQAQSLCDERSIWAKYKMSRHIEDADTRPNSRDEEAYRLAGRDSIESEEKGEEESQEEAEVGFFDP